MRSFLFRFQQYGYVIGTMQVSLPITLKPKRSSNLIRVGRDHDGGYMVECDDIHNASALCSFGISDDWSFENDFLSRKDVPLVAFDGSLTLWFWVRKALRNALSLRLARAFTYFRFLLFFRGKKRLIDKFIGLDDPPKQIKFREALSYFDLLESQRFFLKIDIEGSEYRILDDIVEHNNSISGLVIEFHDSDLNLSRIEEFVQRMPLTLIHVHANNNSPIGLHGVPMSLELTFSSGEFPDVGEWSQHDEDQSNNPAREDFEISFHDSK